MRSFVLRMLTIVTLFAVTLIDSAPSNAQAQPAGCGNYDTLFSRILGHPGDPQLNKEFARQAEACGDVRYAFAALERVVLSSPGDTEAQAEFDRVRNKLKPAITKVTVEAGANYVSNPRHRPRSALHIFDSPGDEPPTSFPVRRPDDATYDSSIGVADERTIAGLRWRSLALAQGQFQDEITELNTVTLGGESGPVFQITPDLWIYVAGGAGITWLDEQKLYDDASASVTLGGLYRGLTQTVTARYTWRDGNFAASKADNAEIFDLDARLVASPLAKGDLLYLVPRLQLSQSDGEPTASREVLPCCPGTFAFFHRPLFPGDFTEAGGRIVYYYPLFRGRAFLGAGMGFYRRWYDEFAAAGESVEDPSDKRRDTYIEPTAHVILPNLLGPNVDVRLDYRFERNTTNATTHENVFPGDEDRIVPADFENHVAGVHMVGRF